MGEDISRILQEWEFDPEDQVRIIEADDGRQVMQVRQPLGIEQYELEGRPDGQRPQGMESLLDVYLARLEEHRLLHGGSEGFSLDHEACTMLQNEGVIYYYRYVVLFQIGDFARTIADTDHNLELCSLVGTYGEKEEDRDEVLQYRPYILRVNAVARAMVRLREGLASEAREILESAIAEIETMPEVDTPTFEIERARSLSVLRSTLKQVLEKRPSMAAEALVRLRMQLKRAVEEEDYELAARLRDKIQSLGRGDAD